MSFNALSFILLAVAAVFLILAVFLARKNAGVEARLQSVLAENEALSQKAQMLEALQQQFAALKAGSEAREQAGAEQVQLLKSAEERLRENFENLAQRIFEEKTSKFKEQNKEQLDALLNPLKTQISEFKQTVQQTNQGIHTLKELNVRMPTKPST